MNIHIYTWHMRYVSVCLHCCICQIVCDGAGKWVLDIGFGYTYHKKKFYLEEWIAKETGLRVRVEPANMNRRSCQLLAG